MNKDTNYFGIDISKDVFDVYSQALGYAQYSNNKKGFREFLKVLSVESHCVMEATGYYHSQLAYFLTEKKVKVSVENPLKIKRFIQMKLSKIKTDKSDAKQICNYAKSNEIKIWSGESESIQESRQILSLLDTLTKQSTQLKNKIHGEKILGKPSSIVLKSLERALKFKKKEILKLEEHLLVLVKLDNQDLLTRLQTIPGIGIKTALMLMVFTNNFENFESSKQLCSYAGITPIIRNSGSSVRSRERISKMGNGRLRNLLFLCSFNACKSNKACKQMFDRLVAKGKSKKLALLAVCNKLLKQAFAIAKSGLIYDDNYRSVLVRNLNKKLDDVM